jgi:hypothetical protein
MVEDRAKAVGRVMVVALGMAQVTVVVKAMATAVDMAVVRAVVRVAATVEATAAPSNNRKQKN